LALYIKPKQALLSMTITNVSVAGIV